MAPLRVLHVLGRMDPGGVENWLLQLARRVHGAAVRLDFLVTQAAPGHHDGRLRALGCELIPCEHPERPLTFRRRFLEVVRSRGYDAVHVHLHHYGGFVLALARGAGVPVRVAHSHTDTRALDAAAPPARRAYLRAMRAAIDRCATHGLAVSAPAAEALFGPRWRDDARFEVVRCALDLEAFPREGCASSAEAVRSELRIPPGATVIGHVGRFDPLKNHGLLLRAAAVMRRRRPGLRLVLVGGGRGRSDVEAEAARLGMGDAVVFAGARDDVARVLGALDAFVFPSLREGLPISVLEAQAAGVPVVLSDAVTPDVAVVPGLVTWRSPADPPEAWADAALAAASGPRPADARAVLERSAFSFARTLPRLLDVWRGTPRAAPLRGAR